MAFHKIRLEAEIEKGDLTSTNEAFAEVLEAAAATLRANERFMGNEVIDVPRGKLAYLIEKS